MQPLRGRQWTTTRNYDPKPSPDSKRLSGPLRSSGLQFLFRGRLGFRSLGPEQLGFLYPESETLEPASVGFGLGVKGAEAQELRY